MPVGAARRLESILMADVVADPVGATGSLADSPGTLRGGAATYETVKVSEVVVLSAKRMVTVFVPAFQGESFLSIANVQLLPPVDVMFEAEAYTAGTVPPLIVTVGVPQKAPIVATEIVMLLLSLPLPPGLLFEVGLILLVEREHGWFTVSVKFWVALVPIPLVAVMTIG
jgi:hypothetical protein